MIRAIIVDDEQSNRDVLIKYLSKYCKNVTVESTASGVEEGTELIAKSRPDLVFLDVEMKDGTGFDLLNKIGVIDFRIIFITAFEKYAVRAFKYSASDYLLKPVNIGELIIAVEKVNDEIKLKSETNNLAILMDIINHQEKEVDTIVITDSKGFKILQLKSIVKIQADGPCTHFFLIDNGMVTSSKNLGFFDYLLDSNNFIQVHKSYYVNFAHIKEYISVDQSINLSSGLSAPLGDTFRKNFIQRFLKK